MKKITLLLSMITCIVLTNAQTTILSEAFISDQGQFTIQNVTLPSEITYVWNTSSYGMKASAYVSGTTYATESWLISPAVDLTTYTGSSLSFEHTGRYFGTMTAEATLWVSENYTSGLPATATWTQVTIPTYMTGADWTFVSSGNIDLSAYAGKSINFAFKYTSSSSAAATWEIKNLLLTGTSGGAGVSNTQDNQFKVYVLGNSLRFQNIESNSKVEIYSALGNMVQISTIQNGQVRLNNISNGLYIVRVGKNTQKIIL